MSAGELNKFLNNRCWSEISKDKIYEFFTLDEKRIKRMLNLAISNDTDFSWRAVWLIGKFAQSENEILKRHYLRIINAIEGKDSGHQRELLKLVINKSLTDEEEEGSSKCVSEFGRTYTKSQAQGHMPFNVSIILQRYILSFEMSLWDYLVLSILKLYHQQYGKQY